MIDKPIIIIGVGGHAKVLLDALKLQNRDIIGFIDKDEAFKGLLVHDVPVLGNDEALNNYSRSNIVLVNGIGSTKSMELRKKIYNNYKEKGFHFETVVHDSAVISSDVILKEGCQILANAVVSCGCEIGENSIINVNASVDHESVVGKHVHIAPGCTICGGVKIGDETHIGSGSVIIQLCKIGTKCLVGAGSLVLEDIPNDSKVFGSPVKVIQKMKCVGREGG